MTEKSLEEAVRVLRKVERGLAGRGAKLIHADRAHLRAFIRTKITDALLARACDWEGKSLQSLSSDKLQEIEQIITSRSDEFDEDILRAIWHLRGSK